jgi:NADH-ubiquinone oxidoreductase chain 1
MVLAAIAFYTLFERKFLAAAQLRQGPAKVGLVGLPQPLADALKLFTKRGAAPSRANFVGFYLAPIFALSLSLILATLYPSPFSFHIPSFTALLFLVVSSLNVYPILAAGWCSNRSYALLGTVRAIAQTISYEIVMMLLLLVPVTLSASYYFATPLHQSWVINLLLVPLVAVAWLVTLLAEANRTPFDFVEGESELVSGFNVEYAASGFALLFMAEYTSILVLCTLTASLFFVPARFRVLRPLIVVGVALFLAVVFVWLRATLPRMRYDRLMMLTWKRLLPFALASVLLVVRVKALWL